MMPPGCCSALRCAAFDSAMTPPLRQLWLIRCRHGNFDAASVIMPDAR